MAKLKDVSLRMDNVTGSESIAMAQNLMNSGRSDVINLTWGQPDFDTPEHIKRAAVDSIFAGKLGYTHSSGIRELREAIADYFHNSFGAEYGSSNILVVPGAKQGLMYLMQVLLNPGDEVILLEPCWLSYKDMIYLSGGVPVSVPAGDNLKPLLESVVDFITPRTKAILINNPVNPSGYVYSREELSFLADVVEKENIYLISDEIYERISFVPFVSLSEFRQIVDRLIIVNGFSKSYAMTGWRIGYILSSPEIIAQASLVHQHTATCAAAPSQYAALAAITGPKEPINVMVTAYRSRRDLLVQGIADSRFRMIKPEGTFYAMLKIPKVSSKYADRAAYLLEKLGLATINGSAYGVSAADYVRISFCCSEEMLLEAILRLKIICD